MKSYWIRAADLARRGAGRGFRRAGSFFEQIAFDLEQRTLLTDTDREILQRNKILLNCHRAKRAFVIGNGPSLNTQDLSLLKNELTFVTNGFWRHSILKTWQPASLLLADPEYFTRASAWAEEFMGMRRAVTGGIFFVPLWAHSVVKSQGLLSSDRTFYAAFYSNMARTRKFQIDLTKPIPGCQTVPLFAITVALYMGCNPIYLLGMDHDFLVKTINMPHFYQKDDIEGKAMQYQCDAGCGLWSYDQWMVAVLDMWRGYRNLKGMAEAKGHDIYNATAGGYLDVFPRIKYENLF